MLILTRRIGEILVIGDDVSVKVLSVNGNQIRAGINAPKTMKILREELLSRQQSEKLKASIVTVDSDI